MNNISTNIELSTRLYDPTRTTVLRNAFAREMKSRFLELEKLIYKAVYERDCFGLKKPSHDLTFHQMTPPMEGAFAFSRSQLKVTKFMEWLEQQIKSGMLTIRDLEQIGSGVEAVWTNKFVYDSYKRGVLRARYEMQKAGYNVPSIDGSGGIGIVLSAPFHIDRLGLIYTRVYSELKGITDSMDAQISRILAQGIADGDGPRLLARKIISVINGDGVDRLGIRDSLGRFIPAKRRAEIMARTEIIRAHHAATIQEYRNWGLLGVRVQAEWKTAGDDRVCDRCHQMEAKGKKYTLDEIEPLIPLHPQCRCIALPYIQGLEKYK